MRSLGPAIRIGTVLLATLLPAVFGAHPAGLDLEGTWLLVEQTYEKGGSNLVEGEGAIRLRIDRNAVGHSAWIWQGEDPAAGRAWPSLVADGRELRAVSRSIQLEAASSTIVGRFEVVPVEGEDLVLDVRESYSLSPDRQSLVGTVEVRFLGGDRNRGGYTLHRRFVREK